MNKEITTGTFLYPPQETKHDYFVIETQRGKYGCHYISAQSDGEKSNPGEWKVHASFTKVASAEFTLPEQWTRARVFQFINSIDQNFQ